MNYSERVKRIVEQDAVGAVRAVMRVVESDVVSLLSDFMSVRHADFDVESDGNGGYVITIKAEADRFFDMGRTASDVDA